MLYILNRSGKRILDILSLDGSNGFISGIHEISIQDNRETCEIIVTPDCRAAQYLRDRNRLLIPDEDGFFREFIIDEYVLTRDNIEVYADASYIELTKRKPIPPATYTGETLNTLLDEILQDTGWKRGITNYGGVRTLTVDDYMNPLEFLNYIATTYEKELRYRVELDGPVVTGRYVDAITKESTNRGREIVSGEDLMNFRKRVSEGDIVTALLGFGPEKEDGSQIVVEVTNEEAREAWSDDGEHLWGMHTVETENLDMTQEEVERYTRTQLNKMIVSMMEWEVEAVDTEYILGRSHQKVRLGDQERIKIMELNPPIVLDARVITVKRELGDDTKKTFVLGEYVEYSADELRAERAQIKAMREALRRKANKNLTDSSGEQTGTINGEDDNFSKAYIGDLSSPTVPAKSQADLLFYVSDRVIGDGLPPSDENDGQSFSRPLETVAEAVRRIPDTLNHEARIVLAYSGDFWEYITLDGFVGSGKIIINGQYKWGTTLNSGLRFRGCQVDVEVRELLTVSNSTYEVFSTNAGRAKFYRCVFKGKPGSTVTEHGLVAFDNGKVEVEDCHFYDVKHGMYAYDGGKIVNKNNKGSCTRYGLQAQRDGSITGEGTAPSGNVANRNEFNMGRIGTNFTFDISTDQSEPITSVKTEKWVSTSSGSYQPNVWDNTTNDVLQGKYGSAGPYWGAWFFGSGPSNAVTGKTIKQIRIYVTRASNSGSGSSVPIEFRAHSYTSRPGGQPGFSGSSFKVSLKRGEGKWIKVPSSFYADFASGNRKGFGIYSGSSNYARMTTRATLEITYEG